MFQRLISLTPVAIAREIDSLLKTLPLSLTQQFSTNPNMKETLIAEVFRQFSTNEVLHLESRNGHSPTSTFTSYPYIQQVQFQLLVRHTLLEVLSADRLETQESQIMVA